MSSHIRLYSPQDKPYGSLSNNSYHPITIDGKQYSTVTNYVFSNMLVNPSNQTLLQHAEITGGSGANQELLNAINYLTNKSKTLTGDKTTLVPKTTFLQREIARRISFLAKKTKKDRSYYEKMSSKKINKLYKKYKEKEVLQNKNIESDSDSDSESEKEYIEEVEKNTKQTKEDKYKEFISRETRLPFSSVDLLQLKHRIMYEGELNKNGIYKLMDKAIYQELYETIFKSVKEAYTELILGEHVKQINGVVKSVLRFPELKSELLSTGNNPIQFKSNDVLLGVGIDNKGENIVGKVLMQIRHSIKMKEIYDKKSMLEEDKTKNIYFTYIAYMILNEEIDKNKKTLVEYIGLTPEQIIDKYGLSNLTKGIPTQETIIKMYKECSLNEVVMKEIFQPGSLVINVRKNGLRNLQSSLKKYKKELIFNLYLEYMVTRNFVDELDKETDRIYDIKEKLYTQTLNYLRSNEEKVELSNKAPDKKEIKQDIIESLILEQKNKLPLYELEKMKEKIADFFRLGMLSITLSDIIDENIEILQIPTDQEVEEAEIAEIPAPLPNSPVSHCVQKEEGSSEGSSAGSSGEDEKDPLANHIKLLLRDKKMSKKSMIKTLLKIQGGDEETYSNMKKKKLQTLIDDLSEKYKQPVEQKEKSDVEIFVKPEGAPVEILPDNKYKPFNPSFYADILTINGRKYPTVYHYMLINILANTGTKRLYTKNGISITKGMGINEAYKRSLNGNKVIGELPEDFKNPTLITEMYNIEEKTSNEYLTGILTEKALYKKFEDSELQNLLLTTGNSILEWDSPYNRYLNLIIGTDKNKGGNLVGIIMMNIRQKLKKELEHVIVKPTQITRFVNSDPLIKSWITMRIKDMCATVHRLQQYLKLKDNLDFSSKNSKSLLKLINFSLDYVYQPCKSLINLSKENESNVPGFIIDIVSKCSGMSSGELPITVYNKHIQQKIEEIAYQKSKLIDDFWGRIKTIDHSKQESEEFRKNQIKEYSDYIQNTSTYEERHKDLLKEQNEADYDKIMGTKKSKEVVVHKEQRRINLLKEKQQTDYDNFWGIERSQKSKDEEREHNIEISKLDREFDKFIAEEKQKYNKYNDVIIKISQIYWNRLASMLSVLIQNLKRSSQYNIRQILIKVQLLNSEPTNCINILSNKENNCIVSAILNLMSGILLFKQKFSSLEFLDLDDVQLACSIILNTKFNISRKKTLEKTEEEDDDVEDLEDAKEDEVTNEDEFKIEEDGLFPEDENVDENPYFDFKNKKDGKKMKTSEKDIDAIEMIVIRMNDKNRNTREISKEIMRMVYVVKSSKMPIKIKQNRINFFATIR